MIEQGTITNVIIRFPGSELSAPTLATDTVLFLEKVYDFNAATEGGGRITIEGLAEPVVYVDIDPDLSTLTLAAPIGIVAAMGDKVLVYPAGEAKYAMVTLEDDDEGIEALVTGNLANQLDTGIRDEFDQESVLVSDESGRWEVHSMDEEIPTILGSMIDPTGMPEPIPLDPPPSSPLIDMVVGMPSSLLVVLEPMRPEDKVEYHISTTDGFVPVAGDPATLIINATKDTIATIATLPNGDPLAPATTYYISVIAVNAVGSAAPSPPKGAALDLSAVEAVVAAKVVAGWVLAGTITVGSITINPTTGITIKQPGGNVIHFPSDNTEYAEINGVLYAQTLTVLGNMNINGPSFLNSRMDLANGIVAPKTPPTVSPFYKQGAFVHGQEYGTIWFGLCPFLNPTDTGLPAGSIDEDHFLTMISFYGAGVRKTHKVTGDTWPYFDISSWAGTSGAAFFPSGGCTVIGENYYILGQDQARSWNWYVYKLDRDFVKVSEWYWAASTTIGGRPAIGRDVAGNILLVYCLASDSNMRVQRRNPTTGANIITLFAANAAQNPTGAAVVQNFCYVEEGDFDFGGSRIMIGDETTKKVHCYAITGSPADDLTKQTALDFATAGVGMRGMAWDTTDNPGGVPGRFVGLAADGYFYPFSTFWSIGLQWKAQSTVVDLDVDGTGTHETAPSTTKSLTVVSRAWVRITGEAAPDADVTDPLKSDKANRVGIYAALSPATPTLQGVLEARDVDGNHLRTMEFDAFSTAGAVAPAILTDFSAAGFTPGVLASAATRALSTKRQFQVDGAGAGRFDALIPVGTPLPYFGTTNPPGGEWLLMDGQTFLETDYPDLAALLAPLDGGAYIVSGTAPNRTMKVPDVRDRTLMGASPTKVLGSLGGADSAALPNHGHSDNFALNLTTANNAPTSGTTLKVSNVTLTGVVGNPTSNPAIATIPKHLVTNWIIKT